MKKPRGNGPKNIRLKNQLIILDLFRKKEIISAADITNSILISKPTIMKILDELEENKLIKNIGKGESSGEGGRKPNLYTFNAVLKYCVAFHIFPHEIYGAVTDLNQKILKDISIPIDSDQTFRELISTLEGAVVSLMKDLGDIRDVAGVAVGSHGITDSEKGITFISTRFPHWGINAEIKKELTGLLGEDIPVFVDNQIRYQVLSEIPLSDRRQSIVVIEAGDGLVAGIYENGSVKSGKHFLAGEVGHIPLVPDGPVCACGSKGCFEELVQLDRLLDNANRMKEKYPESRLFEKRERVEQVEIIFEAANQGDGLACRLMKDVADWFARGIISIQLIQDPECIIIQGKYAEGGDFFLSSLKDAVRSISPLLKERSLCIQLSSLGKNRGVLGGSLLVANHFLSNYLTCLHVS